MTDREGRLVPAKEMAKELEISFEFLSKTLQTLIRKGLIESRQGIRGGYTLTRPAVEISLSDVINALDSKPALVDCSNGEAGKKCEREEACTIKAPILRIQDRINELFASTSFEDLRSERKEDVELAHEEYYQIELNRKELQDV